MRRKPIGDAADFYRLRLMRVDESQLPDLEWRDDILYRRPPAAVMGESERWQVEAIAVDDESLTVIGTFEDANDAHEALQTAEQDLAELTRSEFEERYFPADT